MTEVTTINSDLSRRPIKERTYLFPLLFSIFLTMFLFFIDEGYYSFAWMKDLRNWLIFGCYGLGFFMGTAVIAEFTFKKWTGLAKKMIIILLGLPLGVLFIIAFMYLVMLTFGLTNFLTN